MPPDAHPHRNGHRPQPDLIVAHSSDLHLGARTRSDGAVPALQAVLDAAAATRAHVLVLAGDIFDSNRVPDAVLDAAAELLFWTPFEVVILPGNHDPATADSVYRRPALAAVPNLHVLGVNAGHTVVFGGLDLEVTGAAHTAYADMSPLAASGSRTTRWRVVVAHGHWVTGPHDAHRAWLMHDHEIAATDADYIALGHWERAQLAGDGSVPAYYSGSPELARTVNIARFGDRGVEVVPHPLVLVP